MTFKFEPGARPVTLGPQGTAFVRMCIALAVCKGWGDAGRYAAGRWGADTAPVRMIKAAVGAITTATELNLAGEFRTPAAEFFALVASQTIVGKLTGLRKVPFRTRTITATSGAEANWRGQGGARRVQRMEFDDAELDPLCVSATIVASNDLLRDLSVNAEAIIRADLTRACRQALDASFIDPDSPAITDVRPASITNGLVAVPGGDVGSLPDDLATLFESFAGDLESSYFISTPNLAARISGANYLNCGARGGNIAGIPLVTSSSVPRLDSGHEMLALVDTQGVAIADDGGVEVALASHATIELDDAPSGDVVTPQPTNLVSLFQNNSTAIALDRTLNWKVARPGAVAILSVASGT